MSYMDPWRWDTTDDLVELLDRMMDDPDGDPDSTHSMNTLVLQDYLADERGVEFDDDGRAVR